tara:strand:+ start:129 stop:326 length:198 start_codon:yes stop_codon:yes gene_type:complete
MGKLIDYANNFLDIGGRELGYDESMLPDIKDFKVVLQYNVPVWEYKGLSEEEYYGIDENEGKTMP